MTIKIATMLGFNAEQDGRFFNADGTLGVIVNDDQSVTLIDEDGCPSNHSLDVEHAEHILSRARSAGDDSGAAIRRWDNYASSI